MILPLILPPLLITAKHAQFSARDTDYMLTYSDLTNNWWNILDKLRYMPAYFVFLLIIGLALEFFAFFELVTYYLYQIFPFKAENVLKNMTGVRWISQWLYYICFLFLIAFVCNLLVVAICWFILGAVLNPDQFLPYCAGAGTTVSFIGAQISKINFLRTEIFKRVKGQVWDRLRGLLMATLGAVAIGVAASGVSSKIVSRENKTLQVFAKTSLGNVAGNLGIDHKLAAALAQGDDSAIPILSEKFGSNALIISAVLAVVFKDSAKLMISIEKLALIPAINISPEIAKMIVNISMKQKDVNVRSTVKMATVQFVKMKREMGANQNAYIIDPRGIEALVAMSRGSVDRFLSSIMNSDNIQRPIIEMLMLLKGLIEQQGYEATNILTNLMIEFGNVPSELAKGLASLCDETFSSKFQGDFSGWDSMIDSLCNNLKITDALLIQIIVHITRNNMGGLLRLMTQFTEVLNSKYNWNLDHDILSSLLILINGVKLDIDKFATKYELSVDLVHSLAPIFSEKKFDETQVIIPEIIGTNRNMGSRRESVAGEEEILLANSPHEELKEIIPPFIKAISETYQPTAESME